jgi:hypothetical protein
MRAEWEEVLACQASRIVTLTDIVSKVAKGWREVGIAFRLHHRVHQYQVAAEKDDQLIA